MKQLLRFAKIPSCAQFTRIYRNKPPTVLGVTADDGLLIDQSNRP